jgi:hypothetical protein
MWTGLALAAASPAVFAAETNHLTAPALNERADKIVATLDLGDTNRAARVHGLIVQQYRDLNTIHEVRDAAIKAAKALPLTPESKASAEAAIAEARAVAKTKLDQLHGEFLARLATELSPTQVEKVKDGLTYGVVAGTYAVYLKMYPDLTEAKHAVFGKYKGRINNYLSKAGYDAKKGAQNLKQPAAPVSESNPK